MAVIHNVKGIKILNVTPHELTFGYPGDDEVVTVPPSGLVVNAIPGEDMVGMNPFKEMGVELVTTVFGVEESIQKELVEYVSNGVVPVGSIIAAQAYPGLVFGLIPVKGYERVPPAEKRMRYDKFNVFTK